jgi:transketolase
MTTTPSVDKEIRKQFADTMADVGATDEKLVVLVGDISHGVLAPFRDQFPERYYNVGILEAAIITMSAGLAAVGFKPVMHTIAPFLVERAFEQIKLDFCYQAIPGNLVTVGSAFDYATLGSTHHCYGEFALLKTLQNIEITYPGTAHEFDLLFKQAYSNELLTTYRIPGTSHGVEFDSSEIVLGKAIKVREGTNLTIVACGPQLRSALNSVESLKSNGWDPEIIYVHTIRPLDVEMIRDSVAKTGRVLTVEEHMESGGLGDDVLRATRDMPNVRSAALAIPDRFITEYGSYEDHCESLGLTAEGISSKVASWLGSNS